MRYLIVFLRNLKAVILHGKIKPIYFYVNRPKGIAYLNNEKVACSSIKSSMFNILSDNRDENLGYKKELAEKALKFTAPSNEVKNCYTFTFIRNPFARLVSCYKDKVVKIKDGKFKFEFYLFGYLKKDDEFSAFAKKVCKIPDFWADSHFRSQSFSINQGSKCRVDYVGKLENFDKDFAVLSDKYKLTRPPKFNQSGASDEWMLFYDKEVAQLVFNRYKRDFDIWYPEALSELLREIERRNNQ